jgi:hypothetical protein
MMHVVRSADVRHRFFRRPASKGFLFLMGCQLRLAAESHALAFAGPDPDQFSFNAARRLRTVSIKRPCGVVVSAQISLSGRKPAPRGQCAEVASPQPCGLMGGDP